MFFNQKALPNKNGECESIYTIFPPIKPLKSDMQRPICALTGPNHENAVRFADVVAARTVSTYPISPTTKRREVCTSKFVPDEMRSEYMHKYTLKLLLSQFEQIAHNLPLIECIVLYFCSDKNHMNSRTAYTQHSNVTA
jgi:hypothetical protein